MEAFQLLAPGKVLFSLQEQPPDTEELMAVNACGICHSDRKAFGTPPAGMELPRILGHEVAGTLVRDLNNQGVNAGDRVVLWPAINCGKCRFCITGRENLCPSIKLFGYHLDGGFAEKVYLPASFLERVQCCRIPGSMSLETASLTEPLACILNGFSKIQDKPERVLIVGAGFIGRMAGKAAGILWQPEVLYHDIEPVRLELASGDGKPYDGSPVDLVLVAASAEEAFLLGIENLAPGGTILLFSGMPNICRFELYYNRVHRQELNLVGVYGCCLADMRMALAMLGDGEIAVEELISSRIGLLELADELQNRLHPEKLKTILALTQTG